MSDELQASTFAKKSLDRLQSFLTAHRLNSLETQLCDKYQQKIEHPHGDFARWQAAVNSLPSIAEANLEVSDNCVRLHSPQFVPDDNTLDALKGLMPWRKGPFDFFGIAINTEWNSALKWQRLQAMPISFADKKVLDVGCGNGFFMWQLLNAGADSVLGVDPSWLFYWQFRLFQRYSRSLNVCFLPLGIEDLPPKPVFDTVLSMGILYHRKSPLDHLFDLKNLLKPNGELVLETIVLPDSTPTLLTPKDRYAGMRNVWMVPSQQVLEDWLIKTGFSIKAVSSLTKTTLDEQKQSEWMQFHSLNQFLDSDDLNRTIEGHPAPYRLIIVAEKAK